jgi:ribosome maturation factor RimP
MIAKSQIQEIAERIIASSGLELVDLEQFTSGIHSRVRLLVDRPRGGITIGEIASLTREILVHLDLELDFSQHYKLEISSPGVGRPFKNVRDYERNIGRYLVVRYQDSEGKQKEARGILKSRSPEGFSLEEHGKETEFLDQNILEAKTDVDL